MLLQAVNFTGYCLKRRTLLSGWTLGHSRGKHWVLWFLCCKSRIACKFRWKYHTSFFFKHKNVQSFFSNQLKEWHVFKKGRDTFCKKSKMGKIMSESVVHRTLLLTLISKSLLETKNAQFSLHSNKDHDNTKRFSVLGHVIMGMSWWRHRQKQQVTCPNFVIYRLRYVKIQLETASKDMLV